MRKIHLTRQPLFHLVLLELKDITYIKMNDCCLTQQFFSYIMARGS